MPLWLLLLMAAAGFAPAAEGTKIPAPSTRPRFTSSDAAHDDLLNDLFVRQGRATLTSDSLRLPAWPLSPVQTGTLWRDWEVDMFLWYDYGQSTYPLESRPDKFKHLIETSPIDRFGYAFCSDDNPIEQPTTSGPHTFFGMGWPFPEYPFSQGNSAGWEFNDKTTEGWTIANGTSLGVADGRWSARTRQTDPQLISPSFSAKSFDSPFLIIDLQYDEIDPAATPAEKTLQIYWTTTAEPGFSEDKCVRSDAFPAIPFREFAAGKRYRIYFPMVLHPKWQGQTITRLRIDPITNLSAPPAPRATKWWINYVRLDYDTRHALNNPTLIRAVARKFFWDGDEAFLNSQLPRMRRMMQFMLTHMQADKFNLLEQSWFVGHDGCGWDSSGKALVGHGIGTNYWDIMSMGPKDLPTCIKYYQALQAMAQIEAYVESRPGLDRTWPTVIGPDGVTPVQYRETAASLRARIEPAREAIRKEFWNPQTGRFAGWRTAAGELIDYGYTHFNLEALEAGIPNAEEAKSILGWLDGRRTVAGDTSTGRDIYHWQFAARASTKRNLRYYVWPWVASTFPFGDQVQDGGAVLWTTFFDVKGRLQYGDTEGAWAVWRRMLDFHKKIRDFGAQGADFYRAYYKAHPKEGLLQGGGPPGGLGLDAEFVENLLTPCAWPLAWLGLDSPELGVLQIAPSKPAALQTMGVQGVLYRGNKLNIQASAEAIDLAGSVIKASAPEKLRLVFKVKNPRRTVILRNGKKDRGTLTRTADSVMLETRLGPDRFTVKTNSGFRFSF